MFTFNPSFFIEAALIFALAFAIDVLLGEIPDRIHPTVLMGKIIAFAKPKLKNVNHKIEKINGAFLCIGLIALFSISIFFLLFFIRQIPVVGWLLYIIAGAVLLKATFALKAMRTYTYPIESALDKKDLEGAKRWLHFIVRRSPASLDERHVISATVESIAESSTDGVTSPFFFFALFGVPGAFAFRAVNTLDSMVGYKDPLHANIGWFSAKMDTIANYIPTRLTALLMVASARLVRANWRKSWQILLRDKRKTASPNAGWTMSAMAGALDTQLEKEGYYALGDGEVISPYDITRAWKIMVLTALLFAVLIVFPILALTAFIL